MKKIVRPSTKNLNFTLHPKKPEYEIDYSKWASNQASLLKKGDFEKLDIINLIEEIESLGKSERRMLASYIEILLIHKLKSEFQPEKHTKSWDLSIKHSSLHAEQTLNDNPSLKTQLKEITKKAYEAARLAAALETELPEKTFPKKCPWGLEEIFPKLEKKYR